MIIHWKVAGLWRESAITHGIPPEDALTMPLSSLRAIIEKLEGEILSWCFNDDDAVLKWIDEAWRHAGREWSLSRFARDLSGADGCSASTVDAFEDRPDTKAARLLTGLLAILHRRELALAHHEEETLA